MKKNYIQFLVLALVATGMVMIAGIRNDLNSLETQVANSGRALVNKNATGGLMGDKIANTPSKTFSMAEIENTIKKLGFVKQLDNSYTEPTSPGGTVVDLHYVCPTCMTGGGCCVQNGVGSWSNSPEGCWGSYGTSNYQGICSVPRMDTGGTTATAKTSSGSTGSGGTTANRHMACNPFKRPCTLNGACCYPSSGGAPYGVQDSEGCSGVSGTVQVSGFCAAGRPTTGTTGGTGATTNLKTVNSNGTSNPILTTTLRLGTVSSDVTKLQKMLVSLGFLSTTPSGNFLSKTEAGVKAFQTAYGISPASGIVGPLTREKLNSMCTISSDGSVVTCSQ